MYLTLCYNNINNDGEKIREYKQDYTREVVYGTG